MSEVTPNIVEADMERQYDQIIGAAIQIVMLENHKQNLIQLDDLNLNDTLSCFWLRMAIFASDQTRWPINLQGTWVFHNKVKHKFKTNKKFGSLDRDKHVVTPIQLLAILKQFVDYPFSIEEIYNYFYGDTNNEKH